jgi:hypothetical protein
LLRESVDQGVITRAELRVAVRAGHLRADILDVIDNPALLEEHS